LLQALIWYLAAAIRVSPLGAMVEDRDGKYSHEFEFRRLD